MAEFHFIRPLWFLAVFALIGAMFLLKRLRVSQSGWQQFIPEHLSKVLISGKNNGKPLSLWQPFIIGLITITALAGPSWQKLPQPVYQLARGSVLVMDMSYSMYATDISPNRLTRARYKAIDLLDNINEGEVGLVAYAGDGFIISPLTDDINNIKLLLPSLSPEIMPELGSNPLAALTLANEMLTNAGHIEGDVYWLTDGIDNEDIQDLTDWSRKHPHRLNILGVGSSTGAPITLPNGELMKDDSGQIIIPKLPITTLNGVAKRGRGVYRTIANDFTDINALVKQSVNIEQDQQTEQQAHDTFGDQWQEAGPYLVLLLLPFVLMYFRRGTLVALMPLLLLPLTPTNHAHASLWQDLWQTQNQQAQQKYQQQQYQAAAEQFSDPLWQGSAHYRAGNYQAALDAFAKFDSAQALYNQGNALAKLQQLDQAIAAYDKALAKEPNHQDAKANKALLEQLKNQQQNQQDQSNSESQQENQEQQNQEQQGQDQQNQESGEQNQDQQSSDSSQSEQNQSEQNQQESNSDQSKQQDSNSNQGEQQEQSQSESDAKQENQQEQNEKEQNAQQPSSAEQAEPEQTNQTAAELAQSRQEQETEQKHQQILNKVTDDPYLLLRNKMRLEYQKRRQDQSNLGVKKKW